MRFGDYIRISRKQKGLNQSELAELVGISRSALCRYEAGDRSPSIDVALNILKVVKKKFEVESALDSIQNQNFKLEDI